MCRVAVNVVMLPALLQKQLKNVSFFSMLTLILTAVAIVLVVSSELGHMSHQNGKREPMKMIDLHQLPVFMAT